MGSGLCFSITAFSCNLRSASYDRLWSATAAVQYTLVMSPISPACPLFQELGAEAGSRQSVYRQYSLGVFLGGPLSVFPVWLQSNGQLGPILYTCIDSAHFISQPFIKGGWVLLFPRRNGPTQEFEIICPRLYSTPSNWTGNSIQVSWSPATCSSSGCPLHWTAEAGKLFALMSSHSRSESNKI